MYLEGNIDCLEEALFSDTHMQYKIMTLISNGVKHVIAP